MRLGVQNPNDIKGRGAVQGGLACRLAHVRAKRDQRTLRTGRGDKQARAIALESAEMREVRVSTRYRVPGQGPM